MSKSLHELLEKEITQLNNHAYFGLPEWVFLRFARKLNDHTVIVAPNLYVATRLFEMYTGDAHLFGIDEFISAKMLATNDMLSENRIHLLNMLKNGEQPLIFTHISALLKRMLSPEQFSSAIFSIKKGSEIEYSELLSWLVDYGFKREVVVEKPGDFALRGAIIDIFPYEFEHPIRIELFDTEVESIRLFDVTNQMSIEKIIEVDILPVIDDAYATSTFSAFLNTETTYVFMDWNRIIRSYEILSGDLQILSESGNDETLAYITLDEFTESIKNKAYVSPLQHAVEPFIKINTFQIQTQKLTQNSALAENQIQSLIDSGYTVMFDVSNIDVLNRFPNLNEHSFETRELESFSEMTFIENDVYVGLRQYAPKAPRKKVYKSDETVRKVTLSTLEIGDFIVHEQYGIGKYLGLKAMENKGAIIDYIEVEYAREDRLYLPVDKIEHIDKYIGKEGYAPKLSRLGTNDWRNTKKKINEALYELALNLQKLYNERDKIVGEALIADEIELANFSEDFPFTETNDQLLAIKAIANDLSRPKPMERLLCGDVGFGKTEVAFRAAYQAILAGKQVLMLAPTTVLTAQHVKSAQARFTNTGVVIKELSRFVSKSEVDHTLKSLKEGGVDFVIGTHRLLSKDVTAKNLGLLIIDEEHKFGVEDKAKLKLLKQNIDMLSLSATPIPRTLQMSLSSVIDLSFLETPPLNRYPVQTYVLEASPSLIREAVEREIARSGQVFYLFNRVKGIEREVNRLEKLLPNAKIAYAHGQMPKHELEDIMISFTNREFDVLVATTIIENGIDIPNANTLIINDAQNLGLAQMYQLRGRVGRSDRIAYAYFFYPQSKVISEKSEKRLNAMKSFTELGSGFKIAMQDLFLRGAGDLFSGQQSGFMQSLGFNLFSRYLDANIRLVNGEKAQVIDKKVFTDIDLAIDAFIPETYISDEVLRIELYQNLSKTNSLHDIEQLQQQIVDRFGKQPKDVVNLFKVASIKVQATEQGIAKITREPFSVKIGTLRNLSIKLTPRIIQRIRNNFSIKINIYDNIGRKQFEIPCSSDEEALNNTNEFLQIMCKMKEDGDI